jgi:hypothetical protein
MKTSNIIADINAYLKTENKTILTDLLENLKAEYRNEEAKKKGGNVLLKRQKLIEKLLKQNQKNIPESRNQFHKCWMENINGEPMQIFSNTYYIIALNAENKVNVPTETESINFKAERFFSDRQYHNLHTTEFDISEVKQHLADFKAERKQTPLKKRMDVCLFDIGNNRFNTEFFVNCIEALGENVVFYENEDNIRPSYFEGSAGIALLLPCRKD